MNIFAAFFKPFNDLNDYVAECDRRNAREKELERRNAEINRINNASRLIEIEQERREADRRATLAKETDRG